MIILVTQGHANSYKATHEVISFVKEIVSFCSNFGREHFVFDLENFCSIPLGTFFAHCSKPRIRSTSSEVHSFIWVL